MTIGIVGRKCGMTRVFDENGVSTPVTVIEVTSNRITQVKTKDNDGYQAIQVTTGERKANRVTRPEAGHFKKAGVEAGRGLWEFTTDSLEGFEIGGEIKLDIFTDGQLIDVTGQTKGEGFQGGIKRWNFTMQDATHGNSVSHRSNGSIGQNQSPGKVFRGKKMSGHMGAEQQTTQSLTLVRVDAERNVLLIKGAVPGSKGGDVIIRPAVKAKV